MVKGLKAMNFCDMELNEPGNMNYFIRLKTKKEDKKLLWNNMDTAPKELVSFYRNTIKNLNTAAIK
jgi:hypothetical protein